YGEGRTFLPLREAVLDAAGTRGWPALAARLSHDEGDEGVAAQVAAATGLGAGPAPPDGLFPAVRRLFEILAAERPLVAVFEDVHWAESTFLDLVDHIALRARGPILLLCLARPELLDARPGWAEDALVLLGPLDASDVEQLIAERSEVMPPRPALDRIVGAAQGNPLFAEQLLAAFEEDGFEGI